MAGFDENIYVNKHRKSRRREVCEILFVIQLEPVRQVRGRGQLRRDCYDVLTKNRGSGPPKKFWGQKGMSILPRGTPLFGLNHYVLLNKVWFSGCWVLNRSGIQFHFLAFCTRCRFGLQASKWVWILAYWYHGWQWQFTVTRVGFWVAHCIKNSMHCEV